MVVGEECNMKYKLGLVVLVAVILLVVVPVSAAVLTTSQFGALAQNASGYVDGNPIGGGKGYSDIKTTGDHIVTNTSEFSSTYGWWGNPSYLGTGCLQTGNSRY